MTWEIPVAVVVAVVLVLVFGVHLGRAAAVAVAGEGWGWSARSDLFVTVPRILGGDASAGLPGAQGTHISPVLLRACIAIADALLVALAAVVLRAGLVRWGPWRVRGMSSRSDAERLLGVNRLRESRAVIRPDLYGSPKDQR